MNRIKDLQHKKGQWYVALAALTCDEPQDIVTRVCSRNGAAALRKLVKELGFRGRGTISCVGSAGDVRESDGRYRRETQAIQ